MSNYALTRFFGVKNAVMIYFGVENAVMIYFGVKQCLNEIFCLSNTLMR
jgi:hypothetical protein